VLSASYEQFGHLGTHSLVKNLWSKMTHYGLSLRGHQAVSWIPPIQGNKDISIMELATAHFSTEHTGMSNRCRLYLRLFTIYDLFTHDSTQIHPEILHHQPVTSHISTIEWTPYANPPQQILGSMASISFYSRHILKGDQILTYHRSTTILYKSFLILRPIWHPTSSGKW
jgi:hypothetical protein